MWSVKSKLTQQRLTLETNRFIFSEFGTSLKGTKGSIPATTLAGKTAVRFGPPPPLDCGCVLRAELLELRSLFRVDSADSDFDDFLGILLHICFNMVEINQ